MKHGDCSRGDPWDGAGRDSKVILNVQKEEAKVLEDASSEAHDEKGWHDNYPAITPVRRSSTTGLHLQKLVCRAALWSVLCNKKTEINRSWAVEKVLNSDFIQFATLIKQGKHQL